MSQCNGAISVGLSGCEAAFNKVKNIFISEKGLSFVDIDDANNSNSYKVKIQALTLTGISVNGNYDRTTPDPDVQTTAGGDSYPSNRPPPSLMARGRMTICDYNAMLNNYNGDTFDAFWSTEGGQMVMRRKKTNKTIYGFTCRITAISKGVSDPSAIGDFYEVAIYFANYREFTDAIVFSPTGFNPCEIMDEIPNGLNLSIKTPYTDATDKVVVYVNNRCGAVKTGLVAANFTIPNIGNFTGAEVDAVTDNSDGTYDVTIDDGEASPAGMTVSDWCNLQIVVGVAPATTDVSNVQKIQGGA